MFSSETVLATGDGNGNSYLWNVATGKPLSTIHDPDSNGINGLRLQRGKQLVRERGRERQHLPVERQRQAHRHPVQRTAGDNHRVAISPDGSMVAVGSSGGSTYLWDVAAGQPNPTSTSSLHDPGGKSVYGVAFSPNGSLLAASDTDGSTYLWNVATGQLAATLKDPGSQGLYDVAFSPDGRLLAVSDVSSAPPDGVVYLWNVATGKLASTLASFYDSDFADIAFTPDGRFLAAGRHHRQRQLLERRHRQVPPDAVRPAGQGRHRCRVQPRRRSAGQHRHGGRRLRLEYEVAGLLITGPRPGEPGSVRPEKVFSD